jgi:alkylation response protein AidB-like acyl-CoA dehydrogenase
MMGRLAPAADAGMVQFAMPRTSESYDVMGEKPARAALAGAGIGYEQVRRASVGHGVRADAARRVGVALAGPPRSVRLDSRVSRIYAGTTEIMKEIIGRSLKLGSATAAGESRAP